jgi:hypothetical protein
MKLYISHKNYNWSALKDKLSLLFLNNKNMFNIKRDCNYYSSLEDLGLEADQWGIILDKFEEILLVDLDLSFSKVISDDNLFIYLNFFNFLKKYYYYKTKNFSWIENLPTMFDKVNDTHKSSKSPLWVAGCSISAGESVHDKEKFATILADKLDLNLVSLAQSRSSVTFQADQILRSDIKRNDFVVWGITNYARVDYAIGLDWKSVPASQLKFNNLTWKYWTYDYFDSFTRSFECIKSIQHVNNFCTKIGANLILVNLLDNTWSNLIFSKLPNYLDLTVLQNKNSKFNYIDFGWDNDHPGPKQHAEYASKIYQFIKENYHGKTI